MYWLQKLKEFKDEQKETYKGISQKTGIALTTVEKLFSGRTKEPKLFMIDNIVRALGHSLNELIEPPAEAYDVSEQELSLLFRLRNLDTRGYDRVMNTLKAEEHRIELESVKLIYHKVYYDFPVSAGTGEFLDDSTVAIAALSEAPPCGTDYILRIAGNSMEPEFFDGDYVYVERTNSLSYNEIGIFTLGGNVYIKKYTKEGLRSLNPSYKLISGTPDIKCLGRVLGKLSGNLSVI